MANESMDDRTELRVKVTRMLLLLKHAGDEATGIHSTEPSVEGTQVLLEMAEFEAQSLLRLLDPPTAPRTASG